MVEQLGLDVEIRAQMERFDRNMRAAGRLVDTTVSGMDKSTKRAQQAFNRLEGALDPTARATLRLERDTAKVQRALDKGAISADRAAQVQRRLNDQYEQAVARLSSMGVAQQQSVARVNALNTAQGASALMSGRMGNAVQQAGYQVGDFAVQVASGQGVLRPFIQQGTQLVSMFGPWGAVIGAAGAVVGALATALWDSTDAMDAQGEVADSTREALERYRVTLDTVRGSVVDFESELTQANQALVSNRVLKIQEELEQADKALKVAEEAALKTQDRLAKARENATPGLSGEVDAPSALALRQAEKAAADANKEFDDASQVIDGLNAELSILQFSLGGVSNSLSRSGSSSVATSTKKAGDAFGDFEDRVREAQGALDAFQQGGEEELERYQQYAEELDLASRAFEKYKNEVNDGSKTFEDFRVLAQELGQATRVLSDEQEDAAAAAKRFKESQDEAAKAAEAAAREYEKVWDNAIEDVQRTLKDGIRDALDGNLRSVEDWSRAFLNIIKDLAANLLAQQLVLPVVSSGASALGIPGAPTGGGFNFSSIGSLLTGGTTPGGYSLIGAGGGTFGNYLFGPQTAVAAPYGMGSQLVGGGLLGTNPMLQGAFNNLSNPLNGPAGFAGNFLASQLISQSTGSSIGGTIGGIAGGAAFGPIGAAAGAFLGNALGSQFGTNPASVGPTGVAITSDIFGAGLPDMLTGVDNGGSATAATEALRAISSAVIGLERDLTNAVRGPGQFGLDVSSYPAPEPGSDGNRSAGFGLNEIIDGVKRELDINGLTGEEVLFEGVIRTLKGAFTSLGSSDLDTALQNTASESLEELLADLNFAAGFEDMFARAEIGIGPFEQALEALEAQFDAARDKAEELGLATEGLTARYTQAVADTTLGFEQSLRAENMGVGGEFGSLLNLAGTLEQLSTDASAANVSTDLLADVIDKRLRAAVDGVEPADLDSLVTVFNAMRGSTAGAGRVADFLAAFRLLDTSAPVEDVVEDVVDNTDRISFYQDMYDAHLENIEALKANTEAATELGLRYLATANSRLTNERFSPLDPFARLQEARSQFEAAAGLATDGTDDPETRDAIQRLPDLESTMLEASLAYYGKTGGYLVDFNRGQDVLRGIANDNLTVADRQLAELQSANTTLEHIAGIITNLGGTVTGSSGSGSGGSGSGSGSSGGGVAAPDILGGGTITGASFVERQNAYLENNPDVAAAVASGVFATGYEHFRLHGADEGRGFVTGGSFDIKGRSGADALIMPPVKVTAGEVANISRADTMAMLAQNIAEMQGELAGLRADTQRAAQSNASGQMAIVGAVDKGSQAERRMASNADRQSAA